MAGIWEEIKDLPGVAGIPSANFLRTANRLHETGHGTRLGATMENFALAADVPVSYVDVGMSNAHPVIGVRDFIHGLAREGKVDALFCGHDETDYATFWQKFGQIQPRHPVFTSHPRRLGRVIPVLIHADEGTTLKKKQLMILQWQPLLGHGTSRGGMGLNYLGSSIQTRFLYAVMTGKTYIGKNPKPKRLTSLVTAFATNLGSCFENPLVFELEGEAKEIFLCPLGCKGDWPALTKLGALQRHHLRETWSREDGSGICHLCMGGTLGNKWYDISWENMTRMKANCKLPWNKTPALISLLPCSPEHAAEFFKLDVFHNLHKGLLADAAANAIATGISFCILTSHAMIMYP